MSHITRAALIDPRVGDAARPYRVIRSADPRGVHAAMRLADAVLVNGLSVRGIGAAIAAGRPPVVVHEGPQGVCPSGLAWSSRGACTVNGDGLGPCSVCAVGGWRGHASVRVHRTAMQGAARNVFISDFLRDLVRAPRSVTIYNPVHRRVFEMRREVDEDLHRIAFAGRLVEEKGLDVLLRALTEVPRVELDVVGDGAMRSEWEGLAARLGVADRVRFLGRLPFEALAGIYARAALVCIPSVWREPFGYAVGEAMALGRPVAAFDHGAFSELLRDGRGFLATPVSASSLAATIRQAIGDSERRKSAARSARQFAEQYLGLEDLGRRYEGVLHEVGGV